MGPHVAVSTGASRVQGLDVALGRVAANRFPAHLQLARHGHPHATVAVVLDGGFGGQYRTGDYDCRPWSVVVEPAGSQHANRFGGLETTIFTVSLEPERLTRAARVAAGRFTFERDPFVAGIARRSVAELDRPDDVTPMALEAAAFEIVARICRARRPEQQAPWLGAARAVLHDRFAEALTLSEVAAEVGVSPERLARTFRRAVGEPLPSYVRRIRVEAAATLLATTDLPISRVAADVGFADQSHLTRWFGRYLGTTPARHRDESRGGESTAGQPVGTIRAGRCTARRNRSP